MRFFLLLLLILCSAKVRADSEQMSLSDILCPEECQYNPKYMIRHRSHFGSRQNEYLEISREIISKIKEDIQEAVKSKQDLQAFFLELLDSLARKRRQIAFDHGSPAAAEFGRRRDTEAKSDVGYTYFAAGYQEYGHKILLLLKDILSQMRKDRHFVQKKYSEERSCLGRKSSIEVEVFEKEDIKKMKWFSPIEQGYIPEWFPIDLVNKKTLSFEEDAKLLEAMRRLRIVSPEKYERIINNTMFRELQRYFPPPVKAGKTEEDAEWVGNLSNLQSDYFLATAYFEIGGKMLPLYRYVTWQYRDPEHPEEDPLERMVLHSIVMVIHQYEPFLVETLQDMAKVFEEMVRWKGKDFFELKKLMALFRYGLVSMPFARGTAAITEWLESAIYGYHKIQFQSDEWRMADLEAYVHPFFSDFLKAYNSMYELKKVPTK